MKAIIDADAIIYIAAHHHRVVPEDEIPFYADMSLENRVEAIKECYTVKDIGAALAQVDSLLTSILHAVSATEYIGFLGHRDGQVTFRHKQAVTKPYKGTRGEKPHNIAFWKPIMVNHMVNKWGFHELKTIESDDACCIYQSIFDNTIICSPDKDLRQCKGMFYDFGSDQSGKYSCTADRISNISQFSAMYNLYYQLLVGDSTDNIPGCKGVGKGETDLKDANGNFVYRDQVNKKGKIKVVSLNAEGTPKAGAPKALYNLKTQAEMHSAVFALYKAKHGDDAVRMMNEQLMLVYMLRNPEQVPGGFELHPFIKWESKNQAHDNIRQEAKGMFSQTVQIQKPSN